MEGLLLVVDDEPNVRRSIRLFLEDQGLRVEEAADVPAALRAARETTFDLILMDVRMPGPDGLTFLRDVARGPEAPRVLMMSGHATVELAVAATRLGAHDFLEKPPEPERWLLAIKNALAMVQLARENARLRGAGGLRALLGNSPCMLRLRAEIERVGPTTTRVLLLGENGTGKELVAQALHELSPHSNGPFVKLNCAALPRDLVESELFGHEKGAFTGAVASRAGRLEQARGGTLFLDEVGDLSLESQAKFLRAMETGEFERLGGGSTLHSDARVVSATNRDLPGMVRSGSFREDLYFRLHVVPIQVPPLRDRHGELPLLARHFLDLFAAQHGRPRPALDDDALELLAHHRWPGNVRELRNLMERLVILSEEGRVSAADVERCLPREELPEGSPLRAQLEAVEREVLSKKLDACNWNVSEAALALGLDRGSLHRKIRKHALKRERA